MLGAKQGAIRVYVKFWAEPKLKPELVEGLEFWSWPLLIDEETTLKLLSDMKDKARVWP